MSYFLLSKDDKPDDPSIQIPVESVEPKSKTLDESVTSQDESASLSKEEMLKLINEQNSKLQDYEEKLKHALADFANLQKKTSLDIRTGINNQTDKMFLDFLQIYDDFLRAKDAYNANNIDTDGLDSILKNMDSFLSSNNVVQIEALGEIFNPNFHEAISIISDSQLDDDTITKEIRKGYISNNRVIRPTLVEISKRNK